MQVFERLVTICGWGLILIGIALMFVLAGRPINEENYLSSVVLVLGLLVVFVLAAIFLTFAYRRYTMSLRGWLGFSGLVVLGAGNIQGALNITQPHLSSLITMLFLYGSAALTMNVAILLYRRDIGIKLIAIISLANIWGLFFLWQLQGNVIEQLLFAAVSVSDSSSLLWWLNLLFCFSLPVLVLAIFSVIGHTLRLGWLEFKAPGHG